MGGGMPGPPPGGPRAMGGAMPGPPPGGPRPMGAMPGPPPGGPRGPVKRSSGSFNNVWSKPAAAGGGRKTGGLNEASERSQPPPLAERSAPGPAEWHYVDAQQKESGAITKADLGKLLQSGTVGASSLVWKHGTPGWVAASTIPELKGFLSKPPPPPGGPSMPPPPPRPAPPPPPPVAVNPHAGVLASAQEALATLGIHESNAMQAGAMDQVNSWKAYSTYLTGLVQQLQGPPNPNQAMVVEQLRTGIAQVPPRPIAMNTADE